MRILAIEASGPVAGCAYMEDDQLLADFSLQNKKTHSQSLMPMTEFMRDALELDLSLVDAIATTSGPGSFTGLRIGAATVKGLGLALDRPLIPVPTTESLAYHLCETDALICPIMDARRGQVYAGVYSFRKDDLGENSEGRVLQVLMKQQAVSVRELAEELNRLCPDERRVVFLGDGVPVSRQVLSECMRAAYSFAPAHLSRQRAAATAQRAMDLWRQKGEDCFVPADAFRPEYLRLSQAERELLEAQKAGEEAMRGLMAGHAPESFVP